MHIPRNQPCRNKSSPMYGFMHTNIPCSFVCSCKKLSTTEMPISKEWLNESLNTSTMNYYATIKKNAL